MIREGLCRGVRFASLWRQWASLKPCEDAQVSSSSCERKEIDEEQMRTLDEGLGLVTEDFIYFLIFRVDNSKAKLIRRVLFQGKTTTKRNTGFLCSAFENLSQRSFWV